MPPKNNIHSPLVKTLVFALIVLILFVSKAFPALYGDEYGSLFESSNLDVNLHAIGYFLQLRAWSAISQSDGFLRLLSIIWFAIGLFWLDAWLKNRSEFSGSKTQWLVWLAITNPFLWMYAFQIRFYAMFFAATILVVWRFDRWQAETSQRNFFLLLLATILVCTAHLFGILVLGTISLAYAWQKLPPNRRWILAMLVVFGLSLIFVPVVRAIVVGFVYRMSNPYAEIPEAAMRGITLGMLAKIPFTIYFFNLGERVYPLWWWVTVPALAVFGLAFGLGAWKSISSKKTDNLVPLAWLMLLNIPFLYLVLDPFAPPDLQGAAPRYLIYVLPFWLFFLALGADTWRPLKPALIVVNLLGLYCLAFPTWSYGGSNLTNWPRLLAGVIENPAQTCIITDGRATAPVMRYLPGDAKVVTQGQLSDCAGFKRVALISNDHRLSIVRHFDEMGAALAVDHILASNTTFFPAQVTVYDAKNGQSVQMVPGRMDLPEQDLYFPLDVESSNWQIPGFVRLDAQTPSTTLPVDVFQFPSVSIATNYRSASIIPDGTPVFQVTFNFANDQPFRELTLRSGLETAAWDGSCANCRIAYQWLKRVHLLGSFSYPGAYKQYTASIWASPIPDNLLLTKAETVTIQFLLADGVGYFFGLIP